jgi:hypothetical protein
MMTSIRRATSTGNMSRAAGTAAAVFPIETLDARCLVEDVAPRAIDAVECGTERLSALLRRIPRFFVCARTGVTQTRWIRLSEDVHEIGSSAEGVDDGLAGRRRHATVPQGPSRHPRPFWRRPREVASPVSGPSNNRASLLVVFDGLA